MRENRTRCSSCVLLSGEIIVARYIFTKLWTASWPDSVLKRTLSAELFGNPCIRQYARHIHTFSIKSTTGNNMRKQSVITCAVTGAMFQKIFHCGREGHFFRYSQIYSSGIRWVKNENRRGSPKISECIASSFLK